MKKTLLLACLFSLEALGGTRYFYIKVKGNSEEGVIEKVDRALPGIINGRYKNPHMPVRMLFGDKGCWPNNERTVIPLSLVVRKAYRINRFSEVEKFYQGVVKIKHRRCDTTSDN